MEQLNGVILRSLSGFYTVSNGERQIECKIRGKIRNGEQPLVGDSVRIQYSGDTGCIEEILPRRNAFIRPAVANIDQIIFFAAGVNPVTDPYLIDKFSVISLASKCDFVLCINKADLSSCEHLEKIYHYTPFRVIHTSASTGDGIQDLLECMQGKINVFTGNSGVGKTSILNQLMPSANLPVAEVSEHLGRGKHTTRHVQLFQIESGTFVADTPGFSSFELDTVASIERETLRHYFPEFGHFSCSCRFANCSHRREPGCAVTHAVTNGWISASRYHSYERMYSSLSGHPWESRSE